MNGYSNDLPVRSAARIAGLLYLVIIAGGMFAELVAREPLIVSGDAAATARNLLENEFLYRLGFAVHLLYLGCAIAVSVILYRLLQPVGRNSALLALAFNLVAISVEGSILLQQLAPLRLLSAIGSSGLDAATSHALAYAFSGLYSNGFGISLVFFGFFCIVIGQLIFRSGFLPRVLGVLMMVAGACYLVNSFALFLAPPVAARLFPFILMPCLVAELALALWLLLKGVDAGRWQAAATLEKMP